MTGSKPKATRVVILGGGFAGVYTAKYSTQLLGRRRDVEVELLSDHARSRAYRWGEDGLIGICDRQARLCFALALWNGRDPILKERLFGLTGPEGNHGEDVKELYYYLDATPTSSYLRGLYKYPLAEFPYARLVEENRRRGVREPEYELLDTGVFAEDRYCDVQVEYAKAVPEDILIRVQVSNRSREHATMHVLPTLWFRNTWSWAGRGEGHTAKPELWRSSPGCVAARHPALPEMHLHVEQAPVQPDLSFTDNETNAERLYGVPGPLYAKDAFHEYVVGGRREVVNPAAKGAKAVAHYRLQLAPGESAQLRLRLRAAHAAEAEPFGEDFAATFEAREREADELYDAVLPRELSPQERHVARQAHAGLLWSKQFYHYAVGEWLKGDPPSPSRPPRASAGATTGGGTCKTATSSPCRMSGSTPGTPPGTWPSTCCRWCAPLPRSPSSS